MTIIECLKGMQDMKTLQIDLKTAQINKQERQAQLEPLQKQATQIIAKLEEEKIRMVQEHSECTTLLQEYTTTQMVEALTDKAAQVKEKGRNYQKSSTTRKRIYMEHASPEWIGKSHMSVLGKNMTRKQKNNSHIVSRRKQRWRTLKKLHFPTFQT
jgi:hypothetical protein